MGVGKSKATLSAADLQKGEELKMVANFTDKEVSAILQIFAKLDSDGTGTISKPEIFNLKQFKHNPFMPRIISIVFKEDKDDVTMKEFAQLMSTFSMRASRETKLRFAYQVYDDDDDGKISREDLRRTLKTIIQDNMEEEFLEEVLDKVMAEADSNNDGFIEFEDFSKVVMNTDIEGKLTIDF